MNSAVDINKTRVYHFLPANFALDDLRLRRLKIAEIDQLNDPFELQCVSFEDPRVRSRFRTYKPEMNRKFGMLCFCRGWRSPLLWSHYADKHRGMCLGFDVANDALISMQYATERLEVTYPIERPLDDMSKKLMETKYSGWQYEDEVRSWIRLEERDPATNLYFCNFEKGLTLKEIIVGPLCTVTREEVETVLGASKNEVTITKARLAFGTYEIVEDMRGC